MDNFEACLPATKGFTLFYGHTKGPQRIFSNFFPSPLTDPSLYPGVEELQPYRDPKGAVAFEHVEQYMHALKAIVFNDFDTLEKIMKQGSDPLTAKRLGRVVKDYEEDVWQSAARPIVTRGCVLKFGQSDPLGEELERTGSSMLVECAPRDRRWGVGLGVDNPRATQPGQWRGTNWLGQCLVLARRHLREGTMEELPRLAWKMDHSK